MSEWDFNNSLLSIGRRIKELRQKQGITQAQLAFETEMPRNQIGRIERGEVNTGMKNLLKIAEALNVSPSEIFNVLN